MQTYKVLVRETTDMVYIVEADTIEQAEKEWCWNGQLLNSYVEWPEIIDCYLDD